MARLQLIEDMLIRQLSVLSNKQPLKVGLIISTQLTLAIKLSGTDHNLVVFGNHFKTLWKLHGAVDKQQGGTLIVECGTEAYPITPDSLDVLICAGNIKDTGEIENETALLKELKIFLKPNGKIFRFYPFKRRLLHKLLMSIKKQKALDPHQLCHSAMASGFAEVSQTAVKAPHSKTVIVTSGTAIKSVC